MQNQAAAAIANLKKPFTMTILFGVAVLFFSFFGFLFPYFREIIFFVILAAVLILSIYKLEYGLYAALIELVLGSKGYLFYFAPLETSFLTGFDYHGFNISLRIGIFLVVLGVYSAKLILKKISLNWDKSLIWYVLFFVLIILGFFHGLFRGFGFQNVFLDANGYFYLFYLFPFLSVFRSKEKIQEIKDILVSSGLVLALFTLFLFYIFSHEWLNSDLVYRWLRNNLLFEITYTGSVFRIFAQSQIFLLLVFFLSLSQFLEKKNFYLSVIAAFLSVTAILISLSRSFFVGLLVGIFVFLFVISRVPDTRFSGVGNPKQKMVLVIILICIAAVAFLWTIETNEPLALIGRVASVKPSAIKTEPASFTRQEELKPLLSEIIKKPFLGWGFGKAVTFQTRDPRALTTLPHCIGKSECPYTTYAFEWGYLDLWLKLGFFGLVSLFGVIYSLFKRGWRLIQQGNLSLVWILSSFVAVAITNIFSPYLNHPLGLGILILLTVEMVNSNKKTTPQN